MEYIENDRFEGERISDGEIIFPRCISNKASVNSLHYLVITSGEYPVVQLYINSTIEGNELLREFGLKELISFEGKFYINSEIRDLLGDEIMIRASGREMLLCNKLQYFKEESRDFDRLYVREFKRIA